MQSFAENCCVKFKKNVVPGFYVHTFASVVHAALPVPRLCGVCTVLIKCLFFWISFFFFSTQSLLKRYCPFNLPSTAQEAAGSCAGCFP